MVMKVRWATTLLTAFGIPAHGREKRANANARDNKPTGSVARRIARAVAVPAVVLAVAGGTAPVASAASARSALTLLSCAGAETLSFQPPLTNTSRPTHVHVTINLSLCPVGGVTSGESHTNFVVTTSCTVVDLLPPSFTDTYLWSTGASSAVTYTAPVETVVNGSLVVTDTGTVTAGFDQGAVANETTTLPEPNLTACAGAGVAQVTGPYTLTFG